MKHRFLYLLLISLFLSNITSYASRLTPTRLTCEYLIEPSTIDTKTPRLSWINVASKGVRGERQTAYQIRVASSSSKLKRGEADLWDSGKQSGETSLLIPYSGRELQSRESCWWQVRVWDSTGSVSKWSTPSSWSMGFLNPNEWCATWIGAPWQGEESTEDLGKEATHEPAPLFRKDFALTKSIESAKVYISGLGYFELYLNGKKVGDDVLVPNQTNYGKREDLDTKGVSVDDDFRGYNVAYLSYDVKEYLNKDTNVVGCIVGNGFYNPIMRSVPYGSPRLIAQLHIKYSDGEEEVISTDTSWKVKKSAIIFDDIYRGEHYDARLEDDMWCSPEKAPGSEWQMAVERVAPIGELQAQKTNSDKVMEQLEAKKITKLENGNYLVDFGEEISGWVRLEGIHGEEGHKIELHYICDGPTSGNSSKNTYTMRGGEEAESYATRFSWYVFNEVEVINWPGELTVKNIVAEAVYTDIETTATFECSNPLFNQINKIWRRSLTDNLHGGIISDCPHRERFAYTGDGQVSCVTVIHNYDARSLYTKWIKDINLSQNRITGYVPNGAPFQPGCGGGVAWGAAMNIMPWEFYLHYGDKDLLSKNYFAMKEQLRYMKGWINDKGIMHMQIERGGHVSQWHNLGEWCPPNITQPSKSNFPPDELVHTFYIWRCAELTSRSAKALGYDSDAAKYSKFAEEIKSAFHENFYDTTTKSYGPSGANIFALVMGVPDEVKSHIIEDVKGEFKRHDGHLFTGIFATQFLFEILTENGMIEEAYEAMNKRTFPSFGWWIEQGATTTWEQWDGQNSRNHPMFGGGLNWFYRHLAGFNSDPDQAGYKHIVIKPYLPKKLDYAKYSTLTPQGHASVSWIRSSGVFSLDVEIPVGSYATVNIPIGSDKEILESGKVVDYDNKHIEIKSTVGSYAVVRVCSGKYSFQTKL